MAKRTLRLLSFCGVFLVWMSACGLSPEQLAAFKATSLAATAARWTTTPTSTDLPTSTTTPTATITPTETLTPIPSQTLTPTLISMGTSNPSLVPEARRFYPSLKSYSLVPPQDWKHQYFTILNSDTDGWYPPGADPQKINFTVLLLSKSFEIDFLQSEWQATLKEKSPDFKELRKDRLTSDTGQTYLRWEVNFNFNSVPSQVIYYFYSAKSWSLVITYSYPVDQGNQYDEIVDETMKTVRLSD